MNDLMEYAVKNNKDGKTYLVTLHKDAKPEEIKAAAAEQINKSSGPSAIESALVGAGQSAALNFGDELYGGIVGAFNSATKGSNLGEEYTKARDTAREYISKAKETNPKAYFAGEIGGSLLTPIGVEAAALKAGGKIATKLAPKAQTLGRAVAENAAYSGLAGYGGSNSDDVSTQLTDALGAGVGGAVIGGGIHGASNAAKNFIFSPRYSSDPKAFAAEKLAEAQMRDMGKEGLEKGVNPFADVDAKLQAQAARGENNLMVADYAGENVRDLIRDAADTPNARRQRFKEVLDRRAQTNASDIEKSLKKNLGADENYFKTIEDLDQQMKDVSEPFFKKGREVETPVTSDLKKMFKRPTMAKIKEYVDREIKDKPKDAPTSRIDYLHRMKELLDDMIGKAENEARHKATLPQPDGGAERLVRHLKDIKKEFLGNIENPYYKEGLKRYAGKASLQNALENGNYDVLKLAPEEIAAKLKDLSPAEQDMYRKGAARTLIDKISTGKLEHDRSSFFKRSNMYDLFDVLFPNNKQKGEFFKDLNNAERKHITRQNAQGNSKTNRYRKAAEDADTPANMMDTTSDFFGAVNGNPSSVMNLVKRYLEPYTGYGPKHKAAILDLAMSKAGQAGDIGRVGTENVLRRNAIQRHFENALAGPVSQFTSNSINEPYDGRAYELYNR